MDLISLPHSCINVLISTISSAMLTCSVKLTLVFLGTVLIYNTFGAPAASLYSSQDKVEILNIETFKNAVENSTKAWLVEFYANWCGDCQRFASIWKQFAKDVTSWRDLIEIGVVACSDQTNTALCREFGIVKYPTVKYFREGYQTSRENLGVDLVHDEKVNVDLLKKTVLGSLMKEIIEGRGVMYPNLLPYTHPDFGLLFEEVSDQVKLAVLIVESPGNLLGAEIAMDLHRTPNIIIRHALDNNTDLISNLKVKQLPTLITLERNNNTEMIVENVSSKNEIKGTIRSILADRSIEIQEAASAAEDDLFVASNLDPNRAILREYLKKMGDVIFQADLETALRYSLRQEISLNRIITGEKLQALNTYLEVIKKYFPFGYNSTGLIKNLLELTTEEVKGSQIRLVLEEATENRVFSSREEFLGCEGSLPRYRGYPCGLWRLFHYLTVNSNDSREVLDAMHAYVKNFFGCSRCSEHFQEMVLDRNLTSVAASGESILWLWEAHNVVNNRLKGDHTEDPEFPKEQFPSKERCPDCYKKDGSWNRGEVLKYLKIMYGSYNVRYIGSDTRVMFSGLD